MKRICFSIVTALLLVCFFSSVSATSEAGELFCSDAFVSDDSSFTVDISLDTQMTIHYIEFYVTLPKEINFRSYVLSNSISDRSEVIREGDKHRFVLFSADGEVLGSNEALLSLVLRVDKDVPNGEYEIIADNIKASDADNNTHSLGSVTGTVTVFRDGKAPERDCVHKINGWTVVKSPTYEAEGERAKICVLCGETCKTLKIPVIPRRDISSAEISYDKSCFYTGKALKPEVTVKYKGIILEKGIDYKVSYSDNKSIGKGKITVKGTGAYTGKLTVSFTIKLKTAKIQKIKVYNSGKVRISWSKVKNCDGYRIYVRYPGSNKYELLKTVKDPSKVSYSTNKLKDDGKYRIKVRAYVLSGKKKIFSSYSKIKVFRL